MNNKKNNNKIISWCKCIPKIYLVELRRRCIETMEKIDTVSNNKWHFYRKILNHYDFESRQIAVNRAFYKLWEILGVFNINKAENTLHLAEAPGSFIQVAKRKFGNECKSVAITKQISTYADVVKYGKIIPKFHPKVLKLVNCTFKYVDMLSIVEIKKEIFTLNNKFDFITADGGFDEDNAYDAKERLHYNLILNEIISILVTQSRHGNCVLKIFETFTETMISILWLLCKHYKQFYIFKPVTSRPTNAEKYIICLDYQGMQHTQEELIELMKVNVTYDIKLNHEIPENFIYSIIAYSEIVTKQQIEIINNIITVIRNVPYIDKKEYEKKKLNTYYEWKQVFNFNE